MTPRAQGQEKVNSVPCLRHESSEHASSTLPGGVSNPLHKGSTHCTQLHPAQATYRSIFRDPWFQLHRNKAQVSPAHTAPGGWQSAPGFDP